MEQANHNESVSSNEDSRKRIIREKSREESSKDSDTPKPYECRFCPLKFSVYQALGGHMNRHMKEREHERFVLAQQLLQRELLTAAQIPQSIYMERNLQLPFQRSNSDRTFTFGYGRPVPLQDYANANSSGQQANLYGPSPLASNVGINRSVGLNELGNGSYSQPAAFGPVNSNNTTFMPPYNTGQQANLYGPPALASNVGIGRNVVPLVENPTYPQPAAFGSINSNNTILLPPHNMLPTVGRSSHIDHSSSSQQGIGIAYERNAAPPVFPPNLNLTSSYINSFGELDIERTNLEHQRQTLQSQAVGFSRSPGLQSELTNLPQQSTDNELLIALNQFRRAYDVSSLTYNARADNNRHESDQGSDQFSSLSMGDVLIEATSMPAIAGQVDESQMKAKGLQYRR